MISRSLIAFGLADQERHVFESQKDGRQFCAQNVVFIVDARGRKCFRKVCIAEWRRE